ncbi:MAG: ADP-ribosylglycohydrolase family protein [Clostridiales bacterium]|nr:ADP-ribosylglycohydrolase family protein [Clostridiales bacterium]
MGWIYGEGDFGKSICIAAGCCEDGDCTAATLGEIMGIINGVDALPEKWIEPIGDEIKTISLNLAMETMGIISVPKTVTKLTDRVCNVMPVFLSGFYDVMNSNISMNRTEDMVCKNKYRATFVPEISSVGKLGKMYIPLSLFRAPQEFRIINDKA